MRIKYSGTYYRRAFGLEWLPDGVIDVTDAAVVAGLLTNPLNDFGIAPDEPLLAIVGPEMTPNLALAGITSQPGLAGLDKAGQKRVAAELGLPFKAVGEWIKKAKNALTGAVNETQEI